MTPRQRVLTALDRQRPDRVPVDYWAEPCVTQRLLKDLRLKEQLRKYEGYAPRYGFGDTLERPALVRGKVRDYIPELIEAGVDILNPIQVGARGMVPSEPKQEFGEKLCFHGAVDIQETLPRGTPEDVREEVRTRIGELGHDGGYIVYSTHNLQNDAPTENILAMYDPDARGY